ncbi:MAG: OmpA family protein, partial [Acetobacteraceae bacterium]
MAPGLFAGVLALAPFALVPQAQAQQKNPSAAQIIQSLTPSGDLTHGSTRGIRLASPSANEQPSPQQQAPAGLTPTGNNLTNGNTRGIRLANPQPSTSAPTASPMRTRSAAAPTRTQTATSMPAAPHHAPSVNLNVDFATGSANLTSSARQTLDQLGQALTSQQLASFQFKIVGHTDTVGAPAVNKALSERRADAVAAYLEQKFSVPAGRLQAVGVGEQGLLVATPPQTPNQQNRRVEVINL